MTMSGRFFFKFFVCFKCILSFFRPIFRLYLSACEILAPQLGIEPLPPALAAWGLNHWTASQVPGSIFDCHSEGKEC